MSFSEGSFNNQRTGVLYKHAFERIRDGVVDILRPELEYLDLIPQASWDMSAEPGYQYDSKIAQDYAGAATLRAIGSNNVGTMSTNTKKITNQIYIGGIQNSIDIQDERQNSLLVKQGFATDIKTRTPQIANWAVRNFYEKFLLFGCAISEGSDIYHTGYFTNPDVSVATVPLGGSGFTEWSTKTPDEKIYDLQSAIISISTGSNYTIMCTDVLLPWEQYHDISSSRAGSRANNETILEYVSKFGLPQARNGQGGVTISPSKYLAGGGAGGTNRMVVYSRLPQFFDVTNPIDFKIVSVMQHDYIIKYSYEFQISTLLQPWPAAMAYFDGI